MATSNLGWVAAVIVVLAAPAFAQESASTPSQRPDAADRTPVFRVTVVGRTTAAINYRPQSGDTTVDQQPS